MKAKIANGLMPLIALCALPLQALAQAQNRQPLQPSSKWVVDYADSECRLVRSFGAGADALTLRIARGASFDTYDVVIAGEPIPKLSERVTVGFKLDPQGEAAEFEGHSLAVPGRPERFIRFYEAAPAIFDTIDNKQTLEISTSRGFSRRLKLADAKNALAALKTCHTDLLKDWGIDMTLVDRLKALPTPRGNSSLWVRSGDYPHEALNTGVVGASRVSL